MVEAVCKAKVGNDDIAVLVEQEIFELEVAVHNVFLVQVVHTRDELGKEFLRVLLLEVSAREDVVEQFSA